MSKPIFGMFIEDYMLQDGGLYVGRYVGSISDVYFKEDDIEKAKDKVKKLNDLGVAVTLKEIDIEDIFYDEIKNEILEAMEVITNE